MGQYGSTARILLVTRHSLLVTRYSVTRPYPCMHGLNMTSEVEVTGGEVR
jgi:hypothetical protein